MNVKIIGIFVSLLLITIAAIPAIGIMNKKKIDLEEKIPINSVIDIDWWNMFQHDPQLTGYSTSATPSTNHVQWVSSQYVYTAGFCSPAIVNNKIYIGSSSFGFSYDEVIELLECVQGKKTSSNNEYNIITNSLYKKGNSPEQDIGIFYCINAKNGSYIWYFQTEGFVISSPAIYDDKVYFSSVEDSEWEGKLYCLNANTGKKIWEFSIYTSFYSNPIIVDGKLYLGSLEKNGDVFTGKMTCFNSLNGNVIWEYTIGEDEFLYFSTPAIADGKVFFITSKQTEGEYGSIFCLNSNNGQEIWKEPAVSTLTSPAISNGYVYFTSYNPTNGRDILLCLDADDGMEKWRFTMPNNILSGYSSPAVAYGKVYIATIIGIMQGSRLFCINAEDGDFIWSKTTSDWIMISSPAIADGNIFIASWLYYSIFYCFNATYGSIVWSYPLYYGTMGSPAIANGCVYTVDSFQILCFRDNKPPNSPSIGGMPFGKKGVNYRYRFKAVDPDEDDLYYFIDWGDGNNTGWIGTYKSGTVVNVKNKWGAEGNYIIKAKVMDISGAESDWTEFKVKMPRNKILQDFIFHNFFNHLTKLLPILKLILKLSELFNMIDYDINVNTTTHMKIDGLGADYV